MQLLPWYDSMFFVKLIMNNISNNLKMEIENTMN